MSTSYDIRDDGREQIKQVIAGCCVTLVFKKEDNPNLQNDLTSLIMGAFNDRKGRQGKNKP